MLPRARGSALLIAILATLVLTVIGVGLLRISHREVAGATAAQRHVALSSCAEAARNLLYSRFHVLGLPKPEEIAVLNERLDGPGGRVAAVGGHIGADPSQPLATIKQVEIMPSSAFAPSELSGSGDLTNRLGGVGSGAGVTGGRPLKVTVHCQEGDLSSLTSGRQLELEFAVRFGL